MTSTSPRSPPRSPTRPQPIPIRTRRMSSASSDSSLGSSSPPSPETPAQPGMTPPSRPTIVASSPILSYYLSKSPTGKPGALWGGNFGAPTVFEEPEQDKELPVTKHARRASIAGTGRFGTQSGSVPPVTPDPRTDGTHIFRRLSLRGPATSQPAGDPNPAPPNTAVSASDSHASEKPWDHKPSPRMGRTKQRANTMSSTPRRVPSPMGERILKGHFDGFN